MIKKLFALLLCLLLTAMLPVGALAANNGKRLAISTPEELLRFAESCRLDSYSRGLEVVLTADLNLSGADFQGIPMFSGTFDGGGHTISGLSITDNGSVMGFFRYLTEGAEVKNLHLAGKVQPQGSKGTVGALTGSNAGRISGCSFNGLVSGSDSIGGLVGINLVTGIVENSAVTGSVDGNHFVGGLVGENYGVIRGSTNEANINTTPQQNQVEISDITLETLTGSENAATVTDIGGIAGTSSGVIRNSKNRGNVGYRHMGYNVGGIAGSQSGLITGCDNYGAVSGRKEVGGIVGHLEPGIRMVFSEDTLQTLKTQMDTMGDLAGNAAAAAQGGAAAISGQVGAIRGHAQTAQDALDQLTPTVSRPEGELLPDVTLPDIDSIKAAQNTLSGSLSGMKGSMEGLMSATQSAAGAISGSIQALSQHMETMSQTINNASEGLGGTVTDVSDEDTKEDTTGKISYCDNFGAVLADLNAGGIVGAMALETDLDPEADISISGNTSLNFDGMLRAVALSCTNSASVMGKKQNTGGIVGWMDMGLVKSCVNTGSVEGGDYVGGVAGRSSGYIRKSSAKCALVGDSYVGGIGGQAETVTDCRSMVTLEAREKLGAVVGMLREEQEISGNYYLAVGKDPGAIDGISYEGAAQSLDREKFLALEGLSRVFGTVTVTFCFDDGTTQKVRLAQGEALQTEDIPQIPEKAGYTGAWEGLEDRYFVFDTAIRAVYAPYSTVIEGNLIRPSGRPVLLAEGSFPPEATVTVTHSGELPEESENLLWWNDTITVTASEEVSRAKVLEALSITVPEGCGQVVYRYLPPEDAEETAMLLVRQTDGSWKHVEPVRRGSYLVFDGMGAETVIALVEAEEPLPWWIFAVGALVLICAVTAVCVVKKRKASNKALKNAS